MVKGTACTALAVCCVVRVHMHRYVSGATINIDGAASLYRYGWKTAALLPLAPMRVVVQERPPPHASCSMFGHDTGLDAGPLS